MQIQKLRIARGPRRSSDVATACGKAMRHRGRSTADAGASNRCSTLGQRARRGNYAEGVRASLARATAIDAPQQESSTRADQWQRAASRKSQQVPGNSKHRCMRHATCRSIRTPDAAQSSTRHADGAGDRHHAHACDASLQRQHLALSHHGDERRPALRPPPRPATAALVAAAQPLACGRA